MANKYLRASGSGLWNDNNAWSTTSSAGAANTTKPVAADAVIVDGGSNAAFALDVQNQACTSIVFTGYTGTFTMNFNLTTTSTVTLVAGMTFTPGTATWNMGCATVTCTTGGKHFGNLNFSVGGTLTLADTLNVDSILSFGNVVVVIATSDINCYGISGTSGGIALAGVGRTLNLKGGTWNCASACIISLNVTITNSVTIGNVWFGLSGGGSVLTTTGSTLTFTGTFTFYGGFTLTDTGASTNWAGATITNYVAAVSGTITLSQDTTITNISASTNSNGITLASHNLTVTGNLSAALNGFITGQTITWTGATSGATWSAASGAYIASNLTITGSVTISGNVYYKTGIINTSAATITWNTGAIFNVAGSCTLTDSNANTPNWAGGSIAGYITGTLTLSQITTVQNLSSLINANLTLASNDIIVTKNLTTTGAAGIIGSQTVSMTGSTIGSTWQGGTVGWGMGCNLILIGGSNTITLGSSPNFGLISGKSLTYTSGNIVTTGSTLGLGNLAVTLNTNGIIWNNIDMFTAGSLPITLLSAFTCTGSFTVRMTTTFSGSYLVTVGSISQGAFTLTLSANMTCTGTYTNTGASIINGAYTLSIGGNLNLAYALSGAASITLTAGSTWSASSSSCTLSNALTIAGNTTISGAVYYNNANLYWTSGTVTSVGNSITFVISCTLHGSSGMTFGTVIIPYNVTVTTDGSWTVAVLNMYYLSSLWMASTSTLTVSTSMRLEYCIIRAVTIASPINLTYNGNVLNNVSAFTTFNDVNATIILYIWNATALVRATNISSINQPGKILVLD